MTDQGVVPGVEEGAVTDRLDPTGETVECWTCGTTVDRATIDDRLEDLRAAIDEKRTERNALRSTPSSRRADLSDAREVAETHRELEAELGTVEEAESRLDEVETRLDEREAELETARTRVESLERSAVETFNDHMETVRSQLGYENVERVWIERTATDGDESEFALHVVRATAEDVVYEDTLDHLSESEREVVALAGYLVHDVHETVPVMVLDSLEAIDADRIAALVEYFATFPDHLVVALLPEDARVLPDEHERVQMGGAPA